MKTIVLDRNLELDIMLVSLYSQPNKGLETLRMFDKVLSALEQVAVIKYDDMGNIVAWETDETGNIVRDEKGVPRRATYLKQVPCELLLDDAYCSFLAARLEAAEWTGQVVRDVIKLAQKLKPESEKG